MIEMYSLKQEVKHMRFILMLTDLNEIKISGLSVKSTDISKTNLSWLVY